MNAATPALAGTPEADDMDAVFQALASGARRQMLDVIKAQPGCSVGEVCQHFEMSRIGVMKHLRVLEEAGLVVSRKTGRVRRYQVNATPIQLIHDRWTTEWSAYWASGLVDLKYRVEMGDDAASVEHSPATSESSQKNTA